MQRFSLAQVARYVGVDAPVGAQDVLVGPDVAIDSRAVTPGALFIALRGDRVDGHDFISVAAQAGASAAIVTEDVVSSLPVLKVDDALEALARLATAVVADARTEGLAVVGVTGSAGKTSTKDLVAQVLSAFGPTVAPPGSFNNELGHPLTATRVDSDTSFLVSEMGARGAGHVSYLCQITPPTVGIVLNVGQAHLSEFGSVDAIAKAKGELVAALSQQGWAVLNADDPLVAAMAGRTSAHIAAWSVQGDPVDAELRVWASDLKADDLQRFSFTLNAAGAVTGSAPVTLRLLGRHNVGNALAAAAAALSLGLELAPVAKALSAASVRSPWRMELTERGDGLAVLNDAYNANPDSMSAALRTLAGLRRPGGRLIAVLGDMLELGDGAPAQHRMVGELAADVGVDLMLTSGELGAEMLAGFTNRGGIGHHWQSKAELGDELSRLVRREDVVLFKASRGLGFETIASALLEHHEGADQ